MSSRRLQDVFSVTIFHLPRRLLDALQTSCKYVSRRLQDVLEDEKLLHWRCVKGVFKTCLGDIFRTSWRPRNVCWVNGFEKFREHMLILDLCKVSLYEFHYDYFKNKYDNNPRLSFTSADSLRYEIKAEYDYEDFSRDKEIHNFNNYSVRSKY